MFFSARKRNLIVMVSPVTFQTQFITRPHKSHTLGKAFLPMTSDLNVFRTEHQLWPPNWPATLVSSILILWHLIVTSLYQHIAPGTKKLLRFSKFVKKVLMMFFSLASASATRVYRPGPSMGSLFRKFKISN